MGKKGKSIYNARYILALSESMTNHSNRQTCIMFYETYTSVLDTDNKINGKGVQYRRCFGQEAVCAITLRRKGDTRHLARAKEHLSMIGGWNECHGNWQEGRAEERSGQGYGEQSLDIMGS